jgi:long-chain fatty acid transport protein
MQHFLKQDTKRKVLKTTCLLGLIIPSLATAGGFQLFEQSVSSLGSYHAGGAAVADDASTAWFNSAGLTKLKKQEISVSGVNVMTRGNFKGNATRTSIGSLSETGEAKIHNSVVVPSVQYATPITDRLYFGLDISVPFGLTTDWASDSLVRYQATKSSIQTVNVSPNLAFKVNEQWSIGGGPDYQHLTGDFNSIGGILANNNADTQGKNHVSGYGYGWHIGTLYEMSPETRFGLQYRSAVKHDATGDSFLKDGTLADQNAAGGFPNHTRVNVKVKLPAMTTLSAFHALNEKWDLMASVYYTEWDSIKELKLTNVVGPFGTSDVISPTDYKNTYTIDIGTRYHYNSKWTFSSGVGYDQSPVRDKNRDIRLPDDDRVAVAIGARFEPSSDLRFDFGYAHLFIAENKINKTATAGAQDAELDGKAKGHADLLGIQATWKF